MMFSATSTEKTEALKKLALKKEPVYVGVDDSKESATVDGLEQGMSGSSVSIPNPTYNCVSCLSSSDFVFVLNRLCGVPI